MNTEFQEGFYEMGRICSYVDIAASLHPLVAKAAEIYDRLPIIWLHMAECTGCSEALLRTDAPTIDSLILTISFRIS